MQTPRMRNLLGSLGRGVTTVASAALLTLSLFLILPLLQTISQRHAGDTLVRQVDAAAPPPPEDAPEPEKPPEPEPEELPELQEEAQPLDLSQLELALNPGLMGDWSGGDFAIKLDTALASKAAEAQQEFTAADLEQEARVVYQAQPSYNAAVRAKAPGEVTFKFIVDPSGRVQRPLVQRSSDPVFEAPALAALKQWRFDPAKRNGRAVESHKRVTITFQKGK